MFNIKGKNVLCCFYFMFFTSFSHFCYSKLAASFQSMEVRNSNFAAFIDIFTSNTYVMVVMSDPSIRKFKLNWHRFRFIAIFFKLIAIELVLYYIIKKWGWLHSIVNILNFIDLYILKWLKQEFFCYVLFTTIKKAILALV